MPITATPAPAHRVGWVRYAWLLRPHLPLMASASVLLLVSAALPGGIVWVLQEALNRLLDGQAGTAILPWAALFVGLNLLAGVSQFVRTACTKHVAWMVTGELRTALHRRMLLDGVQGGLGAQLTSLLGEVDELQYGVSALVTAVRNPLTIVVLAVTATWLAPWLALWALVLLPVVAGSAWLGARAVQRAVRRWRGARSRLAEGAAEQLAGTTQIRAFGVAVQEHDRFAGLEREDRRSRRRLDVVRVVPAALVQAVSAAAVGLLLWQGAVQVQVGLLQPEHLVGFVVALGLAARPLSGLAEVWSLLTRSLTALETVDKALSAPPSVTEPDQGASLPDEALAVAMVDVHVSYGAHTALQTPELRIDPGAFVVLVGATGAGKSTLLRLAARLVDPSRGLVFVGGVPLPEVRADSRTSRIAMVTQQTVLFSRSFYENVDFSRGLGESAVQDALTAASAGFVMERGGHDALVSERAGNLSGGEAQRIGLARALAGRPRLLLLDEVTSHVDSVTSDLIIRSVRAVRGATTVLWATHDLHVARTADRVLVLEDGRVVQDGTHEALMAQGGAYCALWQIR